MFWAIGGTGGVGWGVGGLLALDGSVFFLVIAFQISFPMFSAVFFAHSSNSFSAIFCASPGFFKIAKATFSALVSSLGFLPSAYRPYFVSDC